MNVSSQKAYEYCRKIVRAHAENFPVASLLIPKKKRPFVWAIYAFARMADDIADEGYPKRADFQNAADWRAAIDHGAAARLEKLEQISKELDQALAGNPQGPLFTALADTCSVLSLDATLFKDLLNAFCQDVRKRRYESFHELIEYSRYSANPVGRLVLYVFGKADPSLFVQADALCTGLQLANFWQDIAVDLLKDRIYIPTDLLKEHGLSEEFLFSCEGKQTTSSRELQDLLSTLGKKTEPFFEQSQKLPACVKGRLRFELRATWWGGMTILKAACFNPKRKGLTRPKLGLCEKLMIFSKCLGDPSL